MLLQTSRPKLQERALQDNASYDDLLKLGIAKEQSTKGAALLEKASGQVERHELITEDVRRLQKENKQLKSRFPKQTCTRRDKIRTTRDLSSQDLTCFWSKGKLEPKSIGTIVKIRGVNSESKKERNIQLATDTGVSKTLTKWL